MLQQIVAALFALLLGLAFCFAGFQLFRFLVPLWGFLIGFMLGAEAMTAVFGSGFLSTVLGAVSGVVVGLIGAALSFFLYNVAVALLGASVGVLAGAALMESLGVQSNPPVVLVAILGGAIGLADTLLFHLPRMLIIVFSALGGASAVVAGVLLLLNRIELASLEYGTAGAVARVSWLWGVVWLVIAGAGMAVQSRVSEEPAPAAGRAKPA